MIMTIAWGTFDFGRKLAGFDQGASDKELARMAQQATSLNSENESLRRTLATAERQLQIEVATHETLARQLQAATGENATLKEDLAFFQSLMTNGDPGTVTINRFRVEPDALPGEYRYRLLVVQPRERGREFQGRLQLVVDLEQDGRASVMTVPADTADGEGVRLNFKFFQRVEGSFTVPDGTVAKKVQARVIEQGATTPKSSKTFNL
ncbi:MAG: DUF6776 family protein [Betaproteobacteria bacterium]